VEVRLVVPRTLEKDGVAVARVLDRRGEPG
jgi:hypothetical protein